MYFTLQTIARSFLKEQNSNLKKQGIDLTRVFIDSVPHAEVANYLSASDFAFATIKPTPTRLYCCPVKNGEYWANGIPILLEDGIGDDSDIIKNEGGGVIFDHHNPIDGFDRLSTMMKVGRPQLANKIYLIAERHRREELMKEAYQMIIQDYNCLALT